MLRRHRRHFSHRETGIHRVPELGRRYREQVIECPHDVFVQYLKRSIPVEGWKVKDKRHAASTFTALLREGAYGEAVHGLRGFSESEVAAPAHAAATKIVVLLRCGRL